MTYGIPGNAILAIETCPFPRGVGRYISLLFTSIGSSVSASRNIQGWPARKYKSVQINNFTSVSVQCSHNDHTFNSDCSLFHVTHPYKLPLFVLCKVEYLRMAVALRGSWSRLALRRADCGCKTLRRQAGGLPATGLAAGAPAPPGTLEASSKYSWQPTNKCKTIHAIFRIAIKNTVIP